MGLWTFGRTDGLTFTQLAEMIVLGLRQHSGWPCELTVRAKGDVEP